MGTTTGVDYSRYLGGLCGENYRGTISDCYATSHVNGYDNIGGLCGLNNDSTISGCYAAGLVDGYDNIGGLCGLNNDSLIKNCFWDTETSGQSIGYNLDPDYPGTVTNVLGMTTSQMQTQSTFTDYDWDFVGEDVNGTNDIWRMCVDGVHYPHLWWQYSKLGDFECPDGVGLEDILMLTGHWLETELEPLQSPDATGDGKVNLDDFAITSENFEN